MASDADDLLVTDQPARLRIGRVFLPHMAAVGSHFGGDIGPVIDDKRDLVRMRDRHQNVDRVTDRVIRRVLQAQLQAGNVTARQRRFKVTGKTRRLQHRRRDQIEPAACCTHHCRFVG